MNVQTYFVGVDVSKETLDFVLVKEGKNLSHSKIGNTTKEIKHLYNLWKKQFFIQETEVLVCMEHTGVYCYPLLDFLQTAQSKICVENSYTIKHSQGLQRGKNDKIDAERIAMFAWKNRDTLTDWKAPKPSVKKLKQLLSVRKCLISSKKKLHLSVQETGKYVDKQTANELKNSCSKSVKALTLDIKNLESKMMDMIELDLELLRQFNILVSVEGVGKITAFMFIVTTNAFTNFTDAKKYACYAGVVPFEYSSGTSIRGRNKVSNFANKEMKTALHLCALSLIQSKGELGEYFRRKVAEGKNKMSVINAMRNKIVLRAFACVKSDRLYDKSYAYGLKSAES